MKTCETEVRQAKKDRPKIFFIGQISAEIRNRSHCEVIAPLLPLPTLQPSLPQQLCFPHAFDNLITILVMRCLCVSFYTGFNPLCEAVGYVLLPFFWFLLVQQGRARQF